MVREHIVKVKAPRALFVPFPFGMALGKPNDSLLQHRVLAATLDLLQQPTGPVLSIFQKRKPPRPCYKPRRQHGTRTTLSWTQPMR